jgi:hypothetical protein
MVVRAANSISHCIKTDRYAANIHESFSKISMIRPKRLVPACWIGFLWRDISLLMTSSAGSTIRIRSLPLSTVAAALVLRVRIHA